jgi:hypothetical protein
MSTYTPIASQTLASTASSVTFSSIPQGYTDLVLVVAGKNSSSTYSPYIQFNGDTGTNYSITNLYGTGSAAASTRSSSTATAYFGSLGATQGNAIVQIQNYSNSTTNKTALIRINDAGFRVYASVMLWRSTAAITSLTVFNESPGTFASGTTFSIYGIQVGDKAQKAQGGNIVTTDGTYVYHTFTSSGSFTPSTALTVDYLVVAGGGGGSGANGGSDAGNGGGGAGGLRSTVTATGGGGSLESALSLSSGKSYPGIVGAGGAGGVGGANATDGTNGFDSVFHTITSKGGSGGNDYGGSATATGGSGGGAGAGAANRSLGTANQGYDGNTSSGNSGGGGGGAGAIGGTASGNTGGAGGAGVAVAISGSSITYAGGGGGGGKSTGGAGGSSIGGAGGSGNNSGATGTIATGSGGGGGGGVLPSGTNPGGNGGSGIVIIRYAI